MEKNNSKLNIYRGAELSELRSNLWSKIWKKQQHNIYTYSVSTAQHKKILPISTYCTSTHQQLHMLTWYNVLWGGGLLQMHRIFLCSLSPWLSVLSQYALHYKQPASQQARRLKSGSESDHIYMYILIYIYVHVAVMDCQSPGMDRRSHVPMLPPGSGVPTGLLLIKNHSF